jgi:hypothetical protein
VYGVDLDKLKEGERIGVMRTSEVTNCKPWMHRHMDMIWTSGINGVRSLAFVA